MSVFNLKRVGRKSIGTLGTLLMSKVKKSLIWKQIFLVYFHIKQRHLFPLFLFPFYCEDRRLPQSVFKSSNESHSKRKYLGRLFTYFKERSLSALYQREEAVANRTKYNKKVGCFSLGCYENITKWGAHKIHTFISYTSEAWMSKTGVPHGRVRALFQVTEGWLLCPHMVEKVRDFSEISFTKEQSHSLWLRPHN